MTLESRHDFSSNQSKKPFFSPGCARDANGARAGQSCRVFTYRRVVIQEIPPHGPNPDPRPPRGRRPNDRVVVRSSVDASSRVVDVGTSSHLTATPTPSTSPRASSHHPSTRRPIDRSVDAIDRDTQPSFTLALGYGYERTRDASVERVRNASAYTHLAADLLLRLHALGPGRVRGVHDDARGGDGQHD